jgi:hypothetical protein
MIEGREDNTRTTRKANDPGSFSSEKSRWQETLAGMVHKKAMR